MAMLDSTPVFETRLKTLGLSATTVQKFKTNNIDTLAKLAYSSSAQPGSGDESPFLTVVAKVLGLQDPSEIDIGELASIRRAWYEAHTVAVSEIRTRIERTEGSEPARMPLPEREQRVRDLKAKLRGVTITPIVEPSHQLVDFCNQIRTDEQLRYIDPAKCTSREQEIKGVKKESFLKQGADGSVKVVQNEEKLAADLKGEFRVRLALQRRSLALELVQLASYTVIEEYHDHLFQLLLSDVPDSHEPISMQQVLRADKVIFTKMTDLCRNGVSQRGDGSFPIESALKLALLDPIVLATLHPLPKAYGVYKNARSTEDQSSPYPQKGKSRGKGGKGKGSGKQGRSKSGSKGAAVPKELEGLRAQTNKGENICFGCNLESGCEYAKWGQRCRRGLHVCMKCGKGGHGAFKCAVTGA